MQIELDQVPVDHMDRDDAVMFSESAGRFIVTIDPKRRQVFEKQFKKIACACIGKVTATPEFEVKGLDQKTILSVPVNELKTAWKKPFGDLI
jgi:phosphoribosylformylglycinamidine synthase